MTPDQNEDDEESVVETVVRKQTKNKKKGKNKAAVASSAGKSGSAKKKGKAKAANEAASTRDHHESSLHRALKNKRWQLKSEPKS